MNLYPPSTHLEVIAGTFLYIFSLIVVVLVLDYLLVLSHKCIIARKTAKYKASTFYKIEQALKYSQVVFTDHRLKVSKVTSLLRLANGKEMHHAVVLDNNFKALYVTAFINGKVYVKFLKLTFTKEKLTSLQDMVAYLEKQSHFKVTAFTPINQSC